MRIKLAGVLTMVFLLTGAAVSTRAHHGFTIEFDPTKCMDLSGNGTTSQDFADNMNKPMHARACPAREGAGQNRGAAEYIKLADGLIRIVGQVVERDLTPEKLSFWN